jgi:hypothetical protein
MGCRPRSRTTAPGGPPGRGGARLARARHATGALLAAATLFALSPLGAGSCSQQKTIPGQSGDKLVPGIAAAADLDGDGTAERVIVDETTHRLVITDGAEIYQSRDKWQVVDAELGDTDRNKLLEVVTLLDANDGRHLGLFAYVGGKYRERLVTGVLRPRPLSLRVITGDEAAAILKGDDATGGTGTTPDTGDLLVLTEELPAGQSGTQTTIYRWNGFGFTTLDL